MSDNNQKPALHSPIFSEGLRTAVISTAYLRPEMEVAVIGAGARFISAGLAPLVQRVDVIVNSEEMLAEARRELQDFSNIDIKQAGGLSVSLEESSLDVVFSVHHLDGNSDPLVGLQQMARLLKPGGRLVLGGWAAGLSSKTKEGVAIPSQGLDKAALHDWLVQAGLVNVLIHSTGDWFCATGTQRLSGAQGAVREHYAAVALNSGGCCAPVSGVGEGVDSQLIAQGSGSCCSPSPLINLESLEAVHFETGYDPDQRAAAPQEAADFALGCGNPTAMAALRPGEVVLDIGSGGGLDAFLAARQVGVSGKVIGVDMTPEMLQRARASAQKAGLSQVEFRQGQAEALPVDDASVDVILSNCVINLSEDKGQVFREAFRVLKPGGRLEISDMVTGSAFPAQLRQDPHNWGGCVFGALPEQEYLDLIAYAGFVEVEKRKQVPAGIVAGVKLSSITVRAVKPLCELL